MLKYTGTGANEMTREEYLERLAIEKARGAEDRIPARGVEEMDAAAAGRRATADLIVNGMLQLRHKRNQ